MANPQILIAQRETIVPQGVVNLICAWFVVDQSGSMAGSRWQKTQNGVRGILNQLSSADFVGIITFNNEVHVMAAGQMKGLNVAPFFRTSPSGQTALYDAIAQVVLLSVPIHTQLMATVTQQSQGQANVMSYVIVLTDGEDTSSKINLQQTAEILATVNRVRNFKVILAGVGLSGAAERSLAALGRVGDRDIEFRNLRSDNDIADLFEHVSVELRRRKETIVVANQDAIDAIGRGNSGRPVTYNNEIPRNSGYIEIIDESPKPSQNDPHEINHGCHCCLCMLTCGLWCPFWCCACSGCCCEQPCGIPPKH